MKRTWKAQLLTSFPTNHGDARSRAGVTSCPGVLACFCLSLDSFLLSFSQDHLCPPMSKYIQLPKLLPAQLGAIPWRSEGCRSNLLWRLSRGSRGCNPLQSRACAVPWEGNWKQGLFHLFTNYLGAPWPSRNPVPHLKGRGEVRVRALSMQWAPGLVGRAGGGKGEQVLLGGEGLFLQRRVGFNA